MKKSDPKMKLFIRSAITLAVVVMLSRVTETDRHALAGDVGDILTSDVDVDFMVDTVIMYASKDGTVIVDDPSTPAGTGSREAAAETPDMTDEAEGSSSEPVAVPAGSDAPDGQVMQNEQAEPADPDDSVTQDEQAGQDDPVTQDEQARREEPTGQEEQAETAEQQSTEQEEPEELPKVRILPLGDPAERYTYITGSDYRPYRVGEMPAGYDTADSARKHMVTIEIPVMKRDNAGQTAESVLSLTVNEAVADSVREIFAEIHEKEPAFLFSCVKGYSYAKVTGMGRKNIDLMSAHSFGVAVDINYDRACNGLFVGSDSDLRDKSDPYCVSDAVIEIFRSHGWYWGGDFATGAETMHFQYFGTELLKYDDEEPFPILSWGRAGMDQSCVKNLQQRLVRLGYLMSVQTAFTETVHGAVKEFQRDMGLEDDGVVNFETWVFLLNETHDMEYVF